MKALFACAAILTMTPLTAAMAMTPQEEYESYLRYLERESAKGMSAALEKAGADHARALRDLKLEHPWTWWFYDIVVTQGLPDTRKPVSWKEYIGPVHDGGSFLLTSGAFTMANQTSIATPQDLIDFGFTTVTYDASFNSGPWLTIGSSSDAASGFAVQYDFVGFEPIIRARLFDGNGAQIAIYDTNGYDVTETSILAVGVPEPASWAMLITGFGLVGGALRRRRALTIA